MNNSIVERMQSGRISQAVYIRANVDYSRSIVYRTADGSIAEVSYTRAWGSGSDRDMMDCYIRVARDGNKETKKYAISHIEDILARVSPRGSNHDKLQKWVSDYMALGGQVNFSEKLTKIKQQENRPETAAQKKKKQQYAELYSMAEEIVDSSAWDGTAKTARELMSYACPAEIRDLYAEMGLAEDDIAEEIENGNMVILPSGQYERVADGAII